MAVPEGGAGRRRCLRLALAGVLPVAATRSASAQAPAAKTWWLELTEPVPATATDPAQARRLGRRVAAQQARVGARLQAMGIEELGRVQQARNAIAVRLTPLQAELVRALPDVKRLSPAHRLRPPVTMGWTGPATTQPG